MYIPVCGCLGASVGAGLVATPRSPAPRLAVLACTLALWQPRGKCTCSTSCGNVKAASCTAPVRIVKAHDLCTHMHFHSIRLLKLPMHYASGPPQSREQTSPFAAQMRKHAQTRHHQTSPDTTSTGFEYGTLEAGSVAKYFVDCTAQNDCWVSFSMLCYTAAQDPHPC